MKKKQRLGFVGIALATLVLLSAALATPLFGLGVSAAVKEPPSQSPQLDSKVQSDYAIMRPSLETRQRWIERYEMAPTAYISDKIVLQLQGAPGDSVSLLDHLEYTPTERDQGWCGNCWAWAGTGVMEIALDVQSGVKDRLSMQYINSCESSVIGKSCCDGGWLYDVADFYSITGKAVPWSNTNAQWQDGDGSCDTSCASISTDPSYLVASIQEETVPTQGLGEAAAIDNIKNVLHQDKAVWFAFFMPRQAHWDSFFDFWDYDPESAIWNPDYSCGTTWKAGGGGHAVLCVGYNDEAGTENDYWIMLNSWGTASGNRPNGLFRVDMHMDYDCIHWDPFPISYYSFYWQTLDISIGPPSWTYIFEDPSRDTELRVDTDQELFQFLAPDGYDSGVVPATEMTISGDFLSGSGYASQPFAAFRFAALLSEDLCIGWAVVWQPTGPPWLEMYGIYDPSGVE